MNINSVGKSRNISDSRRSVIVSPVAILARHSGSHALILQVPPTIYVMQLLRQVNHVPVGKCVGSWPAEKTETKVIDALRRRRRSLARILIAENSNLESSCFSRIRINQEGKKERRVHPEGLRCLNYRERVAAKTVAGNSNPTRPHRNLATLKDVSCF